MASLKDLRNRIRSVRSTQKITSAMKMVAASRLRRAQEQAEAARPYAQRMERVLTSLAQRMAALPGAPPLLGGTGRDDTHLIVVATSDRGLAGGFNASILREARRRIRELDNAGKTVKVLTIGRKGRDSLRRDYARLIHDSLTEIGRRRLSFEEARDISIRILALFESGGFDVCTIIYNRFRSAMTQIVTVDPNQMGGTPCIRRLRVPIATVVAMVADGMSQAEILAYMDLERDDLAEALCYAAAAVRESELPLNKP